MLCLLSALASISIFKNSLVLISSEVWVLPLSASIRINEALIATFSHPRHSGLAIARLNEVLIATRPATKKHKDIKSLVSHILLCIFSTYFYAYIFLGVWHGVSGLGGGHCPLPRSVPGLAARPLGPELGAARNTKSGRTFTSSQLQPWPR